MVSKIINGKSLIGALNYNEKKVAQGKAELIWENGFPKDIYMLSFNEKLSRLTDRASKNKITKTNTVHISLNFAEGEQLETDQITQIASDYMERIGFGSQPFLVYRHSDAGHPHVHIVSTNIKTTGERICLNNLGKTKSEIARKSIEKDYGLIEASSRRVHKQHETLRLKKVEYGKIDTKRAITNVVNSVISSYKFTSLPELNAALSYYNVIADRGSKESRMYAKNGLLYWALDNQGKKIGIPIKASSIYGFPTLKNLESKFNANENLRKPYKENLKRIIDRILCVKASQLGFKQALERKGVEVIFRKNDQGKLYGVTYVDHQSKVVFNGSDLGKAYSAAALSTWFANPKTMAANSHEPSQPDFPSNAFIGQIDSDFVNSDRQNILSDLLKSEYQDGSISEIPKRRRKKKRKILSR